MKGGNPIKTKTGFLISQIKQIQGRIFDRLLEDSGIEEFNGPQGRILYVLWQQDNTPIRDLCSKTSLAKNTLTSMLARMKSGGLITRRPDSADRRQTIISLTGKARGLKDRYEQVSDQMNALFYKGLTQEDADLLDGVLGQVLENLQAWEREHKHTKGEK